MGRGRTETGEREGVGTAGGRGTGSSSAQGGHLGRADEEGAGLTGVSDDRLREGAVGAAGAKTGFSNVCCESYDMKKSI